MPLCSRTLLRRLKLPLLLLAGGCTMPLPVDLPPGNGLPSSSPVPGTGGDGLGLVQTLENVRFNPAYYNRLQIRYLDLDTCGSNASCINRLNTPLSPLIRYEFFFSDGSPVIGQNPVFNSPANNEPDSPFRRVIRVIVPTGYRANSIRSARDVLASQFRTEDTERVENNPVLRPGLQLPSDNLSRGQAWSEDQQIAYLDLGRIPYAPASNRIGTGIVYFMRNRDSTDLPSRPLPIFDSVPGELLYSPVRQVFRAIAENQADSLNNDPARQIRSQEELLAAVNQGVFRLENTQDYFNYPIYLQNGVSGLQTYGLVLNSARDFQTLPAESFYVLWGIDQLNQPRQILRFRAEGNRLLDLNRNPLPTGPQAPSVFNFSRAELDSFRFLLVTIENEDVPEPTGSTLLQARYEFRDTTTLSVPFASTYQNLQQGFFMLAAPSSSQSQHSSGLWFIQRTDSQLDNPPLPQNLFPGLILSLPPRGWVYNGWVLVDRRNNLWLPTGRFRAINSLDDSNPHLENTQRAYAFPGEDFLRNAPTGVSFPLNLPSTGDMEVVVSLEPENYSLPRPYFHLYRSQILRTTTPLQNQPLPFTPVRFPELVLQLRPESP